MDKKTRDVIRYLIKNYPYESDLTKTRITKLVYLADWEMSQQYTEQITNIKWYFNHYGPYVEDVMKTAKRDKDIKISQLTSAYGTPKYILSPKVNKEALTYETLDYKDKEILNQVINDTESLTWNEFISYVYNTFPVKTSEKYTVLDLEELATQERRHTVRT